MYLGSNRYAYVRCNEIQELPAGMDKDWHPDRQNRLMNMIYVALSSAFLPRPGDVLFTHFRMVFSVHGNELGENDIPFCFLVSYVNVSFCGQEYYCTISLGH